MGQVIQNKTNQKIKVIQNKVQNNLPREGKPILS